MQYDRDSVSPRLTLRARIPTADGVSIALRGHAPSTPAVGVVVASHALLCNAATLDRPGGRGLVSVLVRAGLHVVTVDLRGHGASDGPPPSYDDIVLRDLPAALDHTARTWSELPVAVLGHSLTAHGWLASLAARPHPRVRALVSIAGGAMLPEGRPRTQWWAARAGLELMRLLARRFGGFPARRLGLGPEDAPLPLLEQWARATRRRGWFGEEVDYLSALAAVRTPIYSLTTVADRWLCPPEAARAWLAHACDAPVTERVVGAAPSDPTHIGHVGLVVDPRMAPVWHELADWVVDQLHTVAPSAPQPDDAFVGLLDREGLFLGELLQRG